MTAGLKLPISLMLLIILGLTLGLAHPVSAGGGAFCSRPFVFGGSDVNIVVLPYSLRAPDEQFLRKTSMGDLIESRIARKLSILIQLDTLYALSYPAGMGVVHIIPDISDCRAERILAEVGPHLRKGKGLILLWGHFLEDGEQIYVQSYLRFLRRDRSEEIDFTPPGLPDLQLTGGPAQQAIGFAPRLLEAQDVIALEEAFEAASKIYADRSGDRVTGRMELSLDAPLAYYVDDIDLQTGRMHVRPHKLMPGPEGWIAARANPAILPLRRKLPELAFVNAVAGYLAARIIEEEKQDSPWAGPWPKRLETTRKKSQARFADYLDAIEQDEDKWSSFDERAAVALSSVLTGMLDLLTIRHLNEDDEQDERLDSATRRFLAARRLLPYEAATRNLLAMSHAAAIERDGRSPARAVQAWSNALSLDPGNDEIARNLAQFYSLLLSRNHGTGGLTEAELRARRASLTGSN